MGGNTSAEGLPAEDAAHAASEAGPRKRVILLAGLRAP
jgi:hypothetical protein